MSTFQEVIKLNQENQELYYKIVFSQTAHDSLKKRMDDLVTESLIINTFLKEVMLNNQIEILNRNNIVYKKDIILSE